MKELVLPSGETFTVTQSAACGFAVSAASLFMNGARRLVDVNLAAAEMCH